MLTEILIVAVPFVDKTIFTKSAFVKEQQLRKGSSTPTGDVESVKRVYNEAVKSYAEYMSENMSAWSSEDFGKWLFGGYDEWTPGGSGVNVAKVLAYLGLKNLGLLGKKGNDEAAKEIEARLQAIGISTLLSEAPIHTGNVSCYIDESDKDRTMHADFGASSFFKVTDLKKEYFKDVKLVHFEGYLCFAENGALLEQGIEWARKYGAKDVVISLDLASIDVVNLYKEKFQEWARKVDILFGNEEEMIVLTGAQTLKDAVERFALHQTIVGTNGKDGCYVKDTNVAIAEAFPAQAVDTVVSTVGAGDYFCAGYIYARVLGEKMEKCVDIANLAASRIVQQLSAELPENGRKELKREAKALLEHAHEGR